MDVQNMSIVDDPSVRRLQVIEIVLTCCPHILWKDAADKLSRVPQWLESIREAIQGHPATFSLPDSKMKKQGRNGLTAASADAIKRQDSMENSVSSVSPREASISNGSITPMTTPQGVVVLVNSDGDPYEEPPFGLMDLIPLEVKRLSGGITNELFHVFDRECPEQSVVVRVFGKETERVIFRESELFYQSLFLETYAHGSNFLVYEFLRGYRALPFEDMPKEAKKIAEKVAELQVRATVASKQDLSESTGRSRFSTEVNYLLKCFTQWMSEVSSAETLEKVSEVKREMYTHLVDQLRKESEEMLGVLREKDSVLLEGVCHNDLLSANIMRSEDKEKLIIIDFDYMKRNYLLFDLANHFNEYTGLNCDYARYFPSDAFMATVVKNYREAMRNQIDEAHRLHPELGEVFEKEREHFWTDGEGEAEDKVVSTWVTLVKWNTLLSNLSWSIWSLFQEAVSELDVDFLTYAEQRYNRYMETKDAFMSELNSL